MTLISTRDSAPDFIVKFSPSVCVAVVPSLIGEMAAQNFAYCAHGTADSDKSHGLCAMTKHQISNACSLRLAPR